MIAFVLSTSREESLIPLIFEEEGGALLSILGGLPLQTLVLGDYLPFLGECPQHFPLRFPIKFHRVHGSLVFSSVALKKAMVPFRFPQFPLNIDSVIFRGGGRLLCACGVAPLLSFLSIDLNINNVL